MKVYDKTKKDHQVTVLLEGGEYTAKLVNKLTGKTWESPGWNDYQVALRHANEKLAEVTER
jgi:hypothetical protein